MLIIESSHAGQTTTTNGCYMRGPLMSASRREYIYAYTCSWSGHVDDDDSARASTRKYIEDAHSWRLYRRKMRVRGSGGSDEAAQDEY